MQAAEMGVWINALSIIHWPVLVCDYMSDYAMGQYNVAVQYFSGKGVEQDITKAVEFYEKAAIQGFAPAQV